MGKHRKSKKSRTRTQFLIGEQIRIKRETNDIIRRAKERDARVITLGALVFFSTQTGDAWVLDTEDGLALCLARDGEERPFTVFETPTNFGIEWNANYRIEGDAFIVVERSGQLRSILGYPTREILQTNRQARSEAPEEASMGLSNHGVWSNGVAADPRFNTAKPASHASIGSG